MNNYICVYKPAGLSPLQAIEKLKKNNPKYQNQKIGYAGRLDPMAEGLLMLLIGDENKKRKEYERLDKEYEFEVILGIETDSYDALGIVKEVKIQNQNPKLEIENLKLKIVDIFDKFKGISDQPYPPYSAVRVQGKPLYYWARKREIGNIKIPSKKITINKLDLKKVEVVQFDNLFNTVIEKIKLVQGDFRQQKIISKWKDVYAKYPDSKFIKLTCFIACSSGTYVRSIAHNLGIKLGLGGITLSIKRTKIGKLSEKK